MKNYVTIQSSITVAVAPGLHNENTTDYQSDIANRMKISPSWPKMETMIHQGKHLYPSEVASWPSVLALVKDGLLTIGEYSDGESVDQQEVTKVKTEKTRLNDEITTFEEKVKAIKTKKNISLSDLTK